MSDERFTIESARDAAGSDRLSEWVADFLASEARPVVAAVDGIDLDHYVDALLERFANPQIGDQIARLCLDGSAKFPKFLLPTVRAQLAIDGPVDGAALALAGWCEYLNGVTEAGNPIEQSSDPLLESAILHAKESRSEPAAFLEFDEVFGTDLPADKRFVAAFTAARRLSLAHGLGMQALKSETGAPCGLVINPEIARPAGDALADAEAARIAEVLEDYRRDAMSLAAGAHVRDFVTGIDAHRRGVLPADVEIGGVDNFATIDRTADWPLQQLALALQRKAGIVGTETVELRLVGRDGRTLGESIGFGWEPRDGELVDYGAVAELKRRAFETLWSRFVSRHRERGTTRARAFEAFREAGGTIYSPTAEEKAAFQESAQPVWAWYEEQFGTEWIEAAQGAVRDCEAQLDAEFESAAE